MKVRRLAAGAVGSAAAGVLFAAAAWACVSGPVVNLSTISAKPGQEVGIKGTGFPRANAGHTTLVRFNALDGPVLTTVNPPMVGGNLDTKFTIPEGTKPGNYVIIISQTNPDGKVSLSPVRAVMSVTGDAGTQPVLGAPASNTDTAARATSLARDDQSISTGSLALVALGVGGVGMFLAGMATLFAGRKGSTPEAARVRS